MKKYLGLVLVILLASASFSYADDATINVTFSDFSLQEFDHNDGDPYKGWVNADLFNSTNEAWTGIKFTISPSGDSDVSETYFIDTAPSYLPTSSQVLDNWVITAPVSSTVGATMILYFPTDLVAMDTGAWFKVYTDNTANRVPFKVCVEPIAVPEPATLGLIGIGLVGLILRKRK